MQKRAKITREALLRAAATVFTRVRYPDARLSAITTEAQVSKGALYDHFTSKEDLARAVIEAGSARFRIACRPFLTSPIHAFESLIGISCLLLDPAVNDPMVQATFRLLTQIPDRPGADTTLLAAWLSDCQELARRAVTEGDLPDEDADAVALLLVETLAGVRLLAVATGHLDDLPVRLATAWYLLLPGLVDATKLEYFREFVTRQVARVVDHGTAPQPPPYDQQQSNSGERPSPRTHKRRTRRQPSTPPLIDAQ
jgi:AcrR family transcriptional regulator